MLYFFFTSIGFSSAPSSPLRFCSVMEFKS